ncbi:MAG: amidohydrolase family protein [Gemmatimonadaceae bacterium]|nr:amidohydrolase family protein [Gemmatimonadaceae bacterium]MCC6431012.1 amidohydrolase family protein [Gemmatimonadaceae bacterium]
MRTLSIAVVVCSTFVLSTGCATRTPRAASGAADLVIGNVSVLDVERSVMVGNQDVIVGAGRIVSVSNAGTRRPHAARVLDGTGKYIIPGLWDMHAHLSFSLARAQAELPVFVAYGVTGLRVMSAERPSELPAVTVGLDQARALALHVERGAQVGPHLLALGSWPVDGAAGIGANMPSFYKATTREDGRQLAQYFKARGFDFIKIYDNVPREGFLGLAAEARALGLPFAGREPRALSAIELSAAGQRSIEHSRIFLLNCFGGADSLQKGLLPSPRSSAMLRRMVDEYDAQRCAPVFRAFVQNNTFITPTHVTRRMEALAHDPGFTSDSRLTYIPVGQRMAWLADANTVAATDGALGRQARMDFYKKGLTLTKEAYDAGVPVMLGTDANDSFIFPGSGVHDELAELVTAGLTPAQAIRAATLTSATFLGRTSDFGTVRAGRVADLVLLDADPLADIAHVRRIAAVVMNGRVFERATLDSILVAAEVAARPTAQQRLWIASALGDTADAARALQAGAKIDSLDPQGNRRALNYAALNDRDVIISLLLSRGASVNLANRTGFTPLHHAVEGSAHAALRRLIAAGADLSLKNSAGRTALEYARLRGDNVAVQLLEAAGRRTE